MNIIPLINRIDLSSRRKFHVLEIQADDDSWTTYDGTVDEVNNTVSYTFRGPAGGGSPVGPQRKSSVDVPMCSYGLGSIRAAPGTTLGVLGTSK